MKTKAINIGLLLVGLMTLLCFSGCDGESLSAGYDCIASDGTNTDSIEIRWVDLASDTGELPGSYTLERSDDDITYYELTTVTTTSYTDSAIIPGKTYYYRVYVVYPDGTISLTTEPNSGFAMDAVILPIGSAAEAYHITGSAGPLEADRDWYKIMAQAGWSYTVYTYQDAAPQDTHLYLYAEDDIVTALASDDDGGFEYYSNLTYTFTESGLYYINVVVYGGTASYKITMWHLEEPDMP